MIFLMKLLSVNQMHEEKLFTYMYAIHYQHIYLYILYSVCEYNSQ
jgi:hypothetical protein